MLWVLQGKQYDAVHGKLSWNVKDYYFLYTPIPASCRLEYILEESPFLQQQCQVQCESIIMVQVIDKRLWTV